MSAPIIDYDRARNVYLHADGAETTAEQLRAQGHPAPEVPDYIGAAYSERLTHAADQLEARLRPLTGGDQ